MMLLPVLVTILLGGLMLAFVLYPLYGHAPVEVAQQRASTMRATIQAEAEQGAREAIKEVELDYQLGNLAESDYRSLRDRYTRRAFVAMKSRQQSEEAIDALIEERLSQLRADREQTRTEDEHESATEKYDGATGKDDDDTE